MRNNLTDQSRRSFCSTLVRVQPRGGFARIDQNLEILTHAASDWLPRPPRPPRLASAAVIDAEESYAAAAARGLDAGARAGPARAGSSSPASAPHPLPFPSPLPRRALSGHTWHVSKSLSNGELIDGRFIKEKRAARFLRHVANHSANHVTAKKLDANYIDGRTTNILRGTIPSTLRN